MFDPVIISIVEQTKAALVQTNPQLTKDLNDVATQLRLPREPLPEMALKNTVLVLVPGLHRGVISALAYAKSLSPDCRAVHIQIRPDPLAH